MGNIIGALLTYQNTKQHIAITNITNIKWLCSLYF
jgi:hypothetical protein